MPDIMGEAVDQLVTIEVKNRGAPHGILRALYDAARRHGGGRPLTMVIAEAIKARVKPSDTVLLVTGAGYLPTMPKGESDGPPGAAALARSRRIRASRCWNAGYGCWTYYCPATCCNYYWCQPACCFYPVTYCPYNCYWWGPSTFCVTATPVVSDE